MMQATASAFRMTCPPFRAVGYNCPVEELFAMLAIGTASSSFVI